MNINKVILMGRLTADPELKKTDAGVSVIRFTVAVNRPKQKDKEQAADFISCVAFRQTAEFISKYFRKGSSIIVFGTIRTGFYEKDGTRIYTTDVIADEVNFGESRNQTAESNERMPLSKPTTPQNASDGDGEYTFINDSDLPF